MTTRLNKEAELECTVLLGMFCAVLPTSSGQQIQHTPTFTQGIYYQLQLYNIIAITDVDCQLSFLFFFLNFWRFHHADGPPKVHSLGKIVGAGLLQAKKPTASIAPKEKHEGKYIFWLSFFLCKRIYQGVIFLAAFSLTVDSVGLF